METPATTVKTKRTYTEAQLRAFKKYYQKNKERLCVENAEKAMIRYNTDTEYREKKIASMKTYYANMKERIIQANEIIANDAWAKSANPQAYGMPH